MGKVIMKNQDGEFKKSLAHKKGEEYKEEEEEVVDEVDNDDEDVQGDDDADESGSKTGEGKENEKGVNFETLFLEEKRKREELLEKVMKGDNQNQQQQQQQQAIKPPAAVTLLEENELDDEKFTEVLSDKNKFVKLLNEIGQRAYNKAYEEVLKVVPDVANNVAAFRVTLSELNRSFFERHPELAKMRKFVSSVADELIVKEGINDLQGYEAMLQQLPQRVQEKLSELGIDAKAVSSTEDNKTKKKPSTPAKPGGQRRRPAPEDLDDLSDDFKRSLQFTKKRRGLA